MYGRVLTKRDVDKILNDDGWTEIAQSNGHRVWINPKYEGRLGRLQLSRKYSPPMIQREFKLRNIKY